MCVFTYLIIHLTLGDLAVESDILTPSQSEMFWSYRQTMIYYAADSLVHKIVVDLSRMVRVCLTNITWKKKAIEGGGKASGEAMFPVSLREGANHPITLNKDDLLMDVELIDDSAFCALKGMKTDSREYAVMRANVTQEERGFITEYHKQSEPQGEAHWSEGLGICNPRDNKLDSYNMEPKSSRSMKVVEDNMGFEETSLPDKHDCTLADLYSGHYNVCSVSKETLSRPPIPEADRRTSRGEGRAARGASSWSWFRCLRFSVAAWCKEVSDSGSFAVFAFQSRVAYPRAPRSSA